MNQVITMEVRFFLTSVIWGIILLFIYDILRILRRIIRRSVALVALEDVVFWLMSSILIFRMMYRMNDGIIRGFSIVGMLIGMIIYKYTFSEPLVRWISFLILKIIGFIKKVLRIIQKPFLFIGKQVSKLNHYLVQRVKQFWKKQIYKLRKKYKVLLKILHHKRKRVKMKDNEEDNVREKSKDSIS